MQFDVSISCNQLIGDIDISLFSSGRPSSPTQAMPQNDAQNIIVFFISCFHKIF